MNSIILFAFGACLMHQSKANYGIEVGAPQSTMSSILLIKDDPAPGDLKLVFTRNRKNAMFEAKFMQLDGMEKGVINGELCNINNVTATGLMAKLLQKALEDTSDPDESFSEDCNIPQGVYTVNVKVHLEGHGFDEVLPSGFNNGKMQMIIYAPEDETLQEFVTWNFRVFEEPDE